ncbi:hypothetical protein [Pantoea sp. S62]|uniref:hypothetical protein n=1 Tax=Pantoea sp. S62 TaxID=2769342 RepID=UPI00191264AC|nr:hypothetical protein [Pantoea sp. S62]MBK5017215.1 hypothetical protein [Pantoea sp. S62]
MEITYSIDFQYKPRGNEKPVPAGNVISSSGEETPVMFIPGVGDFVEIGGDPAKDGSLSSFRGVVVSRFFRYDRQSDSEVFCHVNVIVEESFQNFSHLVHE